ncbi:MAG: hypothetical protein M3179_03150 [Actinomycetota bacterium]|nr:hypothetical protein [Actinomycetota bacterium]
MDLSAWAAQRARYSRAKRGRNERGATVVECALIQAAAEAMGVRMRPRPAVESAPRQHAA